MDKRHSEDCGQVFGALSEYLDSELESGDCEQLEKHLQDCPPCIEFLASLKKSVQLCRDCETAESPAPLDQEMKERLKAAYLASKSPPTP